MSDTLSEAINTGIYETIVSTMPEWMEAGPKHDLAVTILEALAPQLNARHGVGGNNPPELLPDDQTEEQRLLAIDPEQLVKVDPERLPEFFRLHYPALEERAAELLERCRQWQADHKTTKGGLVEIKDDAENNALADFIIMIDDFAKEVEEARKRVKQDVYTAGLQIDGWFTRGLAEPVMGIRGVTRIVGGRKYPPEPGSMQFAQTAYLNAKVEKDRQDRLAAAAAAAADAIRKADIARQAAEEESSRAKALEGAGLAPEEAQAVAEVATDRAAEAADSARQTSALIGQFAAERPAAMARTHTATGTTLGLRETYEFEVTSLGALCLAVGAPKLHDLDLQRRVAAASQIGPTAVSAVLSALVGVLVPGEPVPASFVAPDATAINQAIRRKVAPMRECPGIVIRSVASAARRSAR